MRTSAAPHTCQEPRTRRPPFGGYRRQYNIPAYKTNATKGNISVGFVIGTIAGRNSEQLVTLTIIERISNIDTLMRDR